MNNQTDEHEADGAASNSSKVKFASRSEEISPSGQKNSFRHVKISGMAELGDGG